MPYIIICYKSQVEALFESELIIYVKNTQKNFVLCLQTK
jgi:hypothetical protein